MSSKPEVKAEPEFDYRSLGKVSSGDTSTKSKTKSKSSKKSSQSSGAEYGFVKGGNKGSRFKNNPYAPFMVIAAAVILVAGVVAAVLYYTGVFDEKVQVTLADGTVTKITTEQAYAELQTDKFYSGIIIDGIDVGGMTYDEGRDILTSHDCGFGKCLDGFI